MSSRRGKLIYNRTCDFIALNQVVHYICGVTNYHKIEIVIRNSRCFENLHKSGAAQKYLGYKRFEILYLQNGLAFTCCAISFKTIDQCPWLVEIVSCLFSNDLGWIESTLERLLLGVWKSRNLESGPGNWNGTGTGTSIETGVNWEALKPVSNKIQDGVLCYHCFGKFSAQWSWYHRYTHIRKVTCKVTAAVGWATFDRSRLQLVRSRLTKKNSHY